MAQNPELSFRELKDNIERYASIGDYAYTIKLIEKAMPLCEKIFNESTDREKKEVMRANAVKLKQLYEKCKRGLGCEELTYNTSDKKYADKSKAQYTQKRESRNENKSETDTDNKDGEINYVINGVNVEEFLTSESNELVTFDDVKGMNEEKALIEREFFLTDEQRAFNELIGKKPKTFIMLYGVPGTGKTFFAKAISYELKNRLNGDVPFFSVVGSQLSDCKVGATEKNIQAVFEFCKQFEHCVLYIDEFDTIAPDRKQANGDPTAASRVTTLLQMMDGFSSAKGTLVIAATNCPYNLDGAILSRVNTCIEIPLPTEEVIYLTLKSKIGRFIADDVDLSALADKLSKKGYSNRDVKNFMEAVKDMLFDEFKECRENGDTRAFDKFKYTNRMINDAFEKVVPTTKPSDVERIKRFRLSGE